MKVGDLIRFRGTKTFGMIILSRQQAANRQSWVSVLCAVSDTRVVITDFILEYLESCAEVISEGR